jgi:hypothetical protein
MAEMDVLPIRADLWFIWQGKAQLALISTIFFFSSLEDYLTSPSIR